MVMTTRQPVQARALKTRAALLEAAAQEFSAAGYARTTAKTIAQRAGAATGSFYQYFSDKDELLRELGRTRSESLAQRVRTALAVRQTSAVAGRAGLESVIAEVVAYHREDAGLHAVLTERRHADPQLDVIASEAEKRFINDIEQQLRKWGYGGDRRATAFVVFSMVEGAVHGHVLGLKVVSDRRLLSALTDAVVTLIASGVQAGNGAS